MIWQANNPGAEFDIFGTFRGGGNKQFRGGDSLPAGAVMLADPRLIKAEIIKPLQEFEVAFESQRGVLTQRVEGCHKNAEGHAFRKCHIQNSPWLY